MASVVLKLNAFMHPIKQCGQEVILASETLTKREEGRGKREGGDASIPCVLPTSQNPLHWNPSWLRDARTIRKDPE